MATRQHPSQTGDHPAKTALPFPVVGMGASAGGLEAFEQFFRHMPCDMGMAFVLIQHLDPHHPSLLTQIIQRDTAMPVVEAAHQMALQADHVYVIPPNCSMEIADGALQLHPLPQPHASMRMPIDTFFRSLAADQGEHAVGVIFSGNGHDGLLGMRAIRAAGGTCLVQDPDTALFDGMPKTAIEAGYADQIHTAAKMPAALKMAGQQRADRQASPPDSLSASGIMRILSILRTQTGHDFSQYKKSTIHRRIERRMLAHNLQTEAVYARYLQKHPNEVQALFKELLINVTSFFRDPDVFELLRKDVIPTLMKDKPEDYVVRIWVAGCASGEETYSIAMLLREAMDAHHFGIRIQLYSTDLDEDAIATARIGLYPESIAQDVSPERLARFFIKEDAGYRIKKEIREMVIFAVQSIVKDPPFTRLDMLVCRNLLIYLEPELQDRLIPTFHYALKPDGLLLLSPAESIGHHTDLFKPVSRKWKLYKAVHTKIKNVSLLAGGTTLQPVISQPATPDSSRRIKEPQIAELAKRLLIQIFAPPSVVTDLQGSVLYVHGDTSPFLRPAPGHPTLDITEMAKDGLKMVLRETIKRTVSEGLSSLNQEVALTENGATQCLNLSVRLLPGMDRNQQVLLISVQACPDAPASKPARKPRRPLSSDALRIQELELELACSSARIQAVQEEQQISTEELKSTNEELQSTNEELQSSNEELETSKEELQSVNEELVTVNAELQTRIEQMTGMQDDIKNLLENIRIGTLFLDRKLHIRRFTRDATKIYRLVSSDVGRSLGDIRSELVGDDLLADAQAVLTDLTPLEREVRTKDGIWYLARIQPYCTVDNVTDGVVLTFADVTARVHALAARKAQALAEAIVDSVPSPLLVLDDKLTVISANQSYFHTYQVSRTEVAGKPIFDICEGLWNVPEMHTLLENFLPQDKHAERQHVESNIQTQDGHTHLAKVRLVTGEPREPKLMLLSLDRARPSRAESH